MSKAYSNSALVNALGIAEVDFSPPNTYEWRVTQVSVTSDSALSSQAKVYVDQRLFCGSAVGNGDSADGAPLMVNNGSSLRVFWTNCTPNSTCTANIQVEESVVGAQ